MDEHCDDHGPSSIHRQGNYLASSQHQNDDGFVSSQQQQGGGFVSSHQQHGDGFVSSHHQQHDDGLFNSHQDYEHVASHKHQLDEHVAPHLHQGKLLYRINLISLPKHIVNNIGYLVFFYEKSSLNIFFLLLHGNTFKEYFNSYFGKIKMSNCLVGRFSGYRKKYVFKKYIYMHTITFRMN